MASELRNELTSLRLKVENFDSELKNKNEEIQKLTMNRMPLEEKCKVINNHERYVYLLKNKSFLGTRSRKR